MNVVIDEPIGIWLASVSDFEKANEETKSVQASASGARMYLYSSMLCSCSFAVHPAEGKKPCKYVVILDYSVQFPVKCTWFHNFQRIEFRQGSSKRGRAVEC